MPSTPQLRKRETNHERSRTTRPTTSSASASARPNLSLAISSGRASRQCPDRSDHRRLLRAPAVVRLAPQHAAAVGDHADLLPEGPGHLPQPGVAVQLRRRTCTRQGRLAQFVNRKEFFPTRQEFHQYLEWAAARIVRRRLLQLGRHRDTPPPAGDAGRAPRSSARGPGAERAAASGGSTRATSSSPRAWGRACRTGWCGTNGSGTARSSSTATAGRPQRAEERRGGRRRPERGGDHQVLPRPAPARAGARDPAVLRIRVADDTPFANQIFDAAAVDKYYYGDDPAREAFWRYHRNTNYGVVDDATSGPSTRPRTTRRSPAHKRLHFHNLARVRTSARVGQRARLPLTSLHDGSEPRSWTSTRSSSPPATRPWTRRACSATRPLLPA